MNLFVATTPVALLNLRESRRQFGLTEDECALVLVSSAPRYPRSLEQMRTLAGETDPPWSSILALAPGLLGYSAYLVRRSLVFRRLARRQGRVDHLILGHYWPPLFELANRLRYERLVIVDEGSSTLDHFDAACAHRGRLCEGGAPKGILRALGRRLLDVDATQPDGLTFFSAFDLPRHDAISHVRNRYELLRGRAEGCRYEGTWFLGKPWVEKGLVGEAAHDAWLRAAADVLGPDVLYVPHRGESLPARRRAVGALGWRIADFGLPVEEWIARTRVAPLRLAGFPSTAFVTLGEILGDRTEYVVFRDNPDPTRLGRLVEYLEAFLPARTTFIDLEPQGMAA